MRNIFCLVVLKSPSAISLDNPVINPKGVVIDFINKETKIAIIIIETKDIIIIALTTLTLSFSISCLVIDTPKTQGR